MKKVYICGDSFGTDDPEFGVESWSYKLTNRLKNTADVINQSRVCASNLHIALQVDHAIDQSADFIIYMATSSTRDLVKLHPRKHQANLLDRIVDIVDPSEEPDLTPYSYYSLNHTTLFNPSQLLILKEYNLEFFDLDVEVYKNQLIIEAALQRLVDSRIPFLFDRGGFEHSSFQSSATVEYFLKYSEFFSDINVWDFAITKKMSHRPYSHITDVSVNEKIANYYHDEIIKKI